MERSGAGVEFGYSEAAGPGAWKTFEAKIDGAMNAIFEVGNIPVKKIPQSVAFYNNYKKKFGVELESGHGPAPSYESVYILAEAIEQAGTLEPDALVAALEKTDRMGAMGRIRFGKNHQVVYGQDPKETALGCVYQWEKPGVRQIVFPEIIAEDKIQLPEWMRPVK